MTRHAGRHRSLRNALTVGVQRDPLAVDRHDDLQRPLDLSTETRRWLPTGVEFTVRWLLLHLVEEFARHAGHADIIRETIDGKGAWQLEAEAQGIVGPGW